MGTDISERTGFESYKFEIQYLSRFLNPVMAGFCVSLSLTNELIASLSLIFFSIFKNSLGVFGFVKSQTEEYKRCNAYLG